MKVELDPKVHMEKEMQNLATISKEQPTSLTITDTAACAKSVVTLKHTSVDRNKVTKMSQIPHRNLIYDKNNISNK